MIKFKLILSQCLIVLFQLLYSQQLDYLIKLSEDLIKSTKQNIFNIDYSEIQLDSLFQADNINSLYQSQINIKEYEAKNAKNDWGVNLKLHGNFKLMEENSFFEDLNGIVSSKIKTELEWNILENGFLHNKSIARQKIYEKNILELEKLRNEKILWEKQFRLNCNHAINQELLTLFYKKQHFLNAYFDILNELYIKKMVSRDNILKTTSSINILNQQILNLESYNHVYNDSINLSFKNIILPFVEINPTYIQSRNIEEEQLKHYIEIIKEEYKWFKTLNFSVYTSYNLDIDNTSKSIPYLGFRFKLPFRVSYDKEIQKEKIKFIKGEEKYKEKNLKSEKLNFWENYSKITKDVQVQYKNWVDLNEIRRRAKLLKQYLTLEGKGLTLLNICNQEFEIAENMLNLKKQLYTQIGNLISISDNTDISKLIKLQTFDFDKNDLVVRITSGSKYSSSLRIDFLKAKGIKYVILLDTDENLRESLLQNDFIVINEKNNHGEVKDIEQWISDDLNSLENLK